MYARLWKSLPAWSAVWLVALCGCQSLKMHKIWPLETDDDPKVPERVVAVWADTVLHQQGQVPVRGFGGRLMFYQAKKENSVKVEGTLIVYAFDEAGRDPNNPKPDRKYVFTPDQLPAHYSKSQLGHSYSVWIPWDEVGGQQKEISLIVRFMPKEGAPLAGQPSRQLLPGTSAPTVAARTPARSDRMVQQVSYESAAPAMAAPAETAPAQPAARRMSTATIPMTGTLLSRPGATSPAPTTTALPGKDSAPQAAPTTLPQATRPASRSQASSSAPAPSTDPSARNLSQRSRFVPGRSRPLGEPFGRIDRAHAGSPPRPAGSPSGPEPQPSAEPGSGSPGAG